MVYERDFVSCRRKAHVADEAIVLVQRLTQRKFELEMVSDLAAHRQRRTVGRPVGLRHRVQQLTRGTAPNWHARQTSGGSVLRVKVGIQRHCQLSGRRNTQKACRNMERLRFNGVRARGELAVTLDTHFDPKY